MRSITRYKTVDWTDAKHHEIQVSALQFSTAIYRRGIAGFGCRQRDHILPVAFGRVNYLV